MLDKLPFHSMEEHLISASEVNCNVKFGDFQNMHGVYMKVLRNNDVILCAPTDKTNASTLNSALYFAGGESSL